MLKIAVLGARETVMGFKALGLDVFPAETPDEAKKIFRGLARPDTGYAIIYVEENLAKDMGEEIDRTRDMTTPAVILIPGRNGSLGLGRAALDAAVERAVGGSF